MTVSDIYAQARFLSNQTSTSFLDVDCLRTSNLYFFKLVQDIVDNNEDYYLTTSTANTVAARTVNLPTTMLKLLRVEQTWDGTNWYVGTRMIRREERLPIDDDNAAVVDSRFNQALWKYDINDQQIISYPTCGTQTPGLKFWYVPRQAALVTGGAESTVTIPVEFHFLIPIGMASDELYRLGQNEKAEAMYQQYEAGVQRMLMKISNKIILN